MAAHPYLVAGRHRGRGGAPVDGPIRILIADDHAPTRAGIRLALHGRDFNVCAEAEDAPTAVALAEEQRPDVALLDVNMPGNGIVAASLIDERCPDTAIVMLTVSDRNEDLFNALRAGACGYLLKDTPAARLPAALTGVLSGEAALPRALVTRVIDEFRQRGPRAPRFDAGTELDVELTPREWQVLELLRDELSTAEIAARLGMSSVTVRTHVLAISRKLRVPDRKSLRDLLKR